MPYRPDYTTAREQAGFHWAAAGSAGALIQLTGIPIREFNLNPKACIEVYRKGWPLHRELFGTEVGLPEPGIPEISYGHVNALGSELIFPEGGEVGQTHIYESLADGIEALRRPVDFARAGRAPFYLDFYRQIQVAFPGRKIRFPWKMEGPVTTAWELRGDGFFTDLFDNPVGVREFLRLVTDSILEFHRFRCSVDGTRAGNPTGAGLADDVASMVPPALWRELVLPYWEQYYCGQTTGRRSAHVEDLRPPQLPFLEEIGLASYDPSISPKLNPALIASACRVPFDWRLGGFHYERLTVREVEDVVYLAAADGASRVTTHTEECMCTPATAEKVKIFVRAAKRIQQELSRGITRSEIRDWVSASGRQKLWACMMK